MINVKNKFELFALQNHDDGELALVEDTHTYYVWKENKWVEQSTEFSMSLYELNLSMYASKENLTSKQIKEGKKIIKDYARKNKGEFYLLLNNELKYYTIFQVGQEVNQALQNEVYDLLLEFDNVKAIELNDEGLVEIWATYQGTLGLFMLFEYSGGVIKCQ